MLNPSEVQELLATLRPNDLAKYKLGNHSSDFNNPTHNEDLDSTPKDVHFDAKSYLLESLVNRDTLMASPPKIDFLLDEFAGELTRLQSIPPGIDNINLDGREWKFMFFGKDDIFPRFRNDSIPPGIESDDFDSEGDNNSTSLPEFESFHVDYPNSGDSTIDVIETRFNDPWDKLIEAESIEISCYFIDPP
ncbi:hypothetical protein Tco_0670433 [Tanacetum coccineum]